MLGRLPRCLCWQNQVTRWPPQLLLAASPRTHKLLCEVHGVNTSSSLQTLSQIFELHSLTLVIMKREKGPPGAESQLFVNHLAPCKTPDPDLGLFRYLGGHLAKSRWTHAVWMVLNLWLQISKATSLFPLTQQITHF